jgi:glycosyltransferase involved in cell wall biosynthesis
VRSHPRGPHEHRPARRRRVGLPESVLVPRRGGHGRVWRQVLDELDAIVDLVPPGDRRRPEVWLADAHNMTDVPEGAPVVVQAHEAGWLDPLQAGLFGASFAEAIERNTRAAVARAARVITAADAARTELVHAYAIPPGVVDVVPHGVDHLTFAPGRPGAPDLLARAGATPGVPYVLYVSSLHPRKNLASLREAFAGLAGRGFPHLLVVVATSVAVDDEEARAEQVLLADLPGAPGRLVVMPRLSDADLAALYGSADAFCLPSLSEGFGLTALEALACGAPVVASRRGAIPAVLGDAALLVDPTARAIEDGLARVLGSPMLSERLRAAGPVRAAGFSWPATARGWAASIETALRIPARAAAPGLRASQR